MIDATLDDKIVIIYLVIMVPLFFIGIIMFILKRKHPIIAPRGWQLAVFSQVAGFALIIILALASILASVNSSISCSWIIWPTIFFLPVYGLPIALRGYVLYFNYKWRLLFLKKSDLYIRNRLWLRIFGKNSNTTVLATLFIGIGISVLIGGIGVAVTSPSDSVSGIDCTPRFYQILAGVQAIIILTTAISFLFLLYPVKDHFYFKLEMNLLLYPSVPLLFVWVITRFVTGLPIPNQIWGAILFVWGIIVTLIIPSSLALRHRQRFQESDSNMGTVTEFSMSPADLLSTTLNTPVLLESLQKFMVERWNVENLLFLLELRKFDTLSLQDQVLKEEAERIWELYLAPQAAYEINVSFRETEQIKEQLSAGKITSNLFDGVRNSIMENVRGETLYEWKKTEGFRIAMEDYKKTLEE